MLTRKQFERVVSTVASCVKTARDSLTGDEQLSLDVLAAKLAIEFEKHGVNRNGFLRASGVESCDVEGDPT